jgi:hypothetical protein
MNRNESKGMSLAELEGLLEAFGGDSSRWPAARRSAALAAIGADPQARRLHLEAQALDRVLESAGSPDASRMADLVERVVNAAKADGLGGREPASRHGKDARPQLGNVIPLPQPAPKAAQASASVRPRSPDAVPRWQMAAALIGALMLGVAAGTTDFASTATQGLVSVASASGGDAEQLIASLQSDPFGNVLDEDLR